MPVGYMAREALPRDQAEGSAAIAEVLRLLSGGATGAILLALGEGPMQTKVLTHRVRGYTARTIYRYLPKLASIGVVERDDEPSGPAKVVNTLTAEAGSELCAVVDRFAEATMTRVAGGQVEPGTWGSLGLFADLWEAGMVDELSRGPRSATELVQIRHGLSYHQVARRAGQFKAAGFLCEPERTRGRQRRYALTEKARRTMGLVADLARWSRRHPGVSGEADLTVDEITTVLRTSLPLAEVPGHAGKAARISLFAEAEEAEVWVQVDEEGRVQTGESPISHLDGTIEGDAETWLAAILDGEQPVAAEGDRALLHDCLASLYERLWTPSPF
jgi:DNA-binding HxlR family transcriptional regulator